MDPSKIPFNAPIVGPTNSGKSKFVVDQLYGPFRFKFDYIVLICPTFAHNKTYRRIGENDPRMNVLICEQHEVEVWLKLVSWLFEGTNTLVILDDCAASKDVKGRTGQLVNLAFSARHIGISVWVLTQKFTSITASFRENVAAIVLFYIPSANTMKAIFDDYAGDLSLGEYKGMVSKLKERKFSYLVFSLRHPFGVKLFEKNESRIYAHCAMAEEVFSADDMKQIEAIIEAEPSSGPAAPGPDIPALRENLAVLVSTGKAKEPIGVQLTHEQVKRLSDKEVERYTKRYETYVGSKTTESLIDSCIFLVTKVVGMAVKIKDIDAYQKELRNDYILNNELSILAGNLALKCGRFLAAANAALITTKHIDFDSPFQIKAEEEIPQQSSPSVEHLQTNA